MAGWQELEIKDFQGLSNSDRNPPLNSAQVIKNLDLRNIYGDMEIRKGYSKVYDPPVAADYRNKTSGTITTLSFATFYTPEQGGKEVTVLIQKATLVEETPYDNSFPPITNRNIIAIWCRPYWSGSAWVDSWRWLNECFLTRIYYKDPAVGYLFDLNTTDDGKVAADFLDGWSVINLNKTSYEVLKVVKTVTGSHGELAVKLNSFSNTWTGDYHTPDGEALLFMRNHIRYDYLTAMYSVPASDIVFHKVLNDLRIGFGGKADRLSLSVGYRKKYWRLKKFEGSQWSADTDYTTSANIEAFAKIDGIVLDPYNSFGTGLSIVVTEKAGGTASLSAGTYYFRGSVVLDGFEEYLLTETNITITTPADLLVTFSLEHAKINQRATAVKIYWSNDGQNYYLFSTHDISNQDSLTNKTFINDPSGNLTTLISQSSAEELIPSNQAAVPTGLTEANSVGNWTYMLDPYSSVTSVSTLPPPKLGSYSIKLSNANAYTVDEFLYLPLSGLEPNTFYQVDLYVYHSYGGTVSVGFHYGEFEPVKQYQQVIPAGTWTLISQKIKTFNQAVEGFAIGGLVGNGYYIGADDVSIKKIFIANTDTLDANNQPKYLELGDSLGYTPTFDYAKSWDQAVVSAGKTFLVNPYIDRRYNNKVFFSPITGDGAFAYDVITADNYIDLENFDGNDLTGISFLPNQDFLAFKRNSVQRVDSNTGASRSIDLGKGCTNRNTIVNFGDRIAWGDENDLYMTDGYNIQIITDKTIRTAYKSGLTSSSVATREEIDSAYRILLSSGNQYVLTKKGWVNFDYANDPTAFSLSANGLVVFMDSTGKIYVEMGWAGGTDTTTAITAEWKSILFSIPTIFNEIKPNFRFLIKSVWARVSFDSPLAVTPAFTLKFYKNAAAKLGTTATYSFDVLSRIGTDDTLISCRLPLNTLCDVFALGFSATLDKAGYFKIHSIGCQYKLIPYGRYADN